MEQDLCGLETKEIFQIDVERRLGFNVCDRLNEGIRKGRKLGRISEQVQS